jgi:myo-inositol-1(or 4)-monophosphatase
MQITLFSEMLKLEKSMSEAIAIAAVTEFAHRLAAKSGEVILPHFRAGGDVANKQAGGFDPVTEADRGAEVAMRRMIEAEYPAHGIAGEEFADKASDDAHCWVLDPIDGTKSFIIGMPTWGTLIGLSRGGRPILDMMNQPYVGERFWNTPDGARFRNRQGERAIHTRRCHSLSEAIIGATSPDLFKGGDAQRFQMLSQSCRLTRYGGDCYLYCLLAMGLVDIAAETSLKPFDIAPLIPIIEAAGGKVTRWDGGDPSGGGRILAVGDPSLHAAAMDALT